MKISAPAGLDVTCRLPLPPRRRRPVDGLRGDHADADLDGHLAHVAALPQLQLVPSRRDLFAERRAADAPCRRAAPRRRSCAVCTTSVPRAPGCTHHHAANAAPWNSAISTDAATTAASSCRATSWPARPAAPRRSATRRTECGALELAPMRIGHRRDRRAARPRLRVPRGRACRRHGSRARTAAAPRAMRRRDDAPAPASDGTVIGFGDRSRPSGGHRSGDEHTRGGAGGITRRRILTTLQRRRGRRVGVDLGRSGSGRPPQTRLAPRAARACGSGRGRREASRPAPRDRAAMANAAADFVASGRHERDGARTAQPRPVPRRRARRRLASGPSARPRRGPPDPVARVRPSCAVHDAAFFLVRRQRPSGHSNCGRLPARRVGRFAGRPLRVEVVPRVPAEFVVDDDDRGYGGRDRRGVSTGCAASRPPFRRQARPSGSRWLRAAGSASGSAEPAPARRLLAGAGQGVEHDRRRVS